jgi:hypothetical protein
LNEQPPNHARATPPPTTTPSSNPVNQNYDPDAPPTRRFAVGAIVVTAVALLTMLGLLLYRSLTQSAPSAVLIVQGDPHWDGARLLVFSVGTTGRPTRLAGHARPLQQVQRHVLPLAGRVRAPRDDRRQRADAAPRRPHQREQAVGHRPATPEDHPAAPDDGRIEGLTREMETNPP